MDNLVYKVENPEYRTAAEIRDEYWGKQVLITNIEMSPDYSKMDGGIVRYYAIDNIDGLYQAKAELRDAEGDALEICGIEYIGELYLNLYARSGVS